MKPQGRTWRWASRMAMSTTAPGGVALVPSGYPLVNIQKAMENDLFIDGLPIKNGDFLYSYVSHYHLVMTNRAMENHHF